MVPVPYSIFLHFAPKGLNKTEARDAASRRQKFGGQRVAERYKLTAGYDKLVFKATPSCCSILENYLNTIPAY